VRFQVVHVSRINSRLPQGVAYDALLGSPGSGRQSAAGAVVSHCGTADHRQNRVTIPLCISQAA